MTNDYDSIFHKLDNAPSFDAWRSELIDFLKTETNELRGKPENAVRIAYGIAGMLATKFAHELAMDDPIDEILTIAGELEANPTNSNELRVEMVEKIELL